MLNMLKTGLLSATALLGAFLAPMAQATTAETVTLAASPATDAKPALWVIKDADSTIYLFGSIHVMKPGTNWLNPQVQKAFDSAQDVWFEVPNLDDQAAAAAIAQKYMIDPSGSLTAGLTPQEITQLDTLLKPMGGSTAAFKNLRKWAVGLVVTLQQINELGYSPKEGVDVTLMAKARQANKGVRGFETLQQQIELMVPTSDEEELKGLRTLLKDSGTVDAGMRNMFNAWTRGDEAGLETFLVDKIKTEDANVYQRLIVQRNAAWEPQIETILAGKGTTFIAVGAGHLIGPDSVIKMLKGHGIKVERVRY